jgi:WXXGXW repeat (2 copies)
MNSAIRSTVLALAVSFVPVATQAGVIVSVGIAPPVLPVYVQPAIPAPGYLWTPGYWAYGPEGYFWVPGVWVQPPQVGLLWTPGYWGWGGGMYRWNAGYWGPHVGFYGGVNYGFGYGGVGFVGGRWGGGVFSYNAAVMNVGAVRVNSYHETVVVNNVHTSFNGGAGGIRASASASERSAMSEHHFEATREQTSHHEMASHDRGQLASVNHGRPSNMAMSRPRSAGAGPGSTGHAAGGVNHATGGGAANHSASAVSHSGGNAGGSKAGGSGSVNHTSGGSGRAGGGAPAPHAAAAASHPAGGGGQAHSGGGGGGGAKGGGSKGGGRK